jgi:hypothetical protein
LQNYYHGLRTKIKDADVQTFVAQLFGDVVSLDSTYTTNQYNMIFVPFTRVNKHLQSVSLGGAFLSNEKIESYVWLFKTFLKAMGGAY